MPKEKASHDDSSPAATRTPDDAPLNSKWNSEPRAEVVPLGELATFRSRDALALTVLLTCLAVLGFSAFVGRDGLRIGYVEVDSLQPLDYRPRIDLNRSEWAELCLLPGVSETLAKRIVSQRNVLGGYDCVAQIQLVRGIGPVLAARLQPWLHIETPRDLGSPQAVDASDPVAPQGQEAMGSRDGSAKTRLGTPPNDEPMGIAIIRSLE